ncbi:16S rRNA (adenine(1518)-N(6)/adenine(1519)-N(6))-dimethyltransferase RsmA [Desulfobacterota bacterium M19]
MNIKDTLQDNNLAPKKRFGQNFLVQRQMVEAILNRAAPEISDTILELGVGLGAMTIPLAARVKGVIGLEIDSGLVRWHEEEGDLPANVSLRHEDLLESDFRQLAAECGGQLRIIANLPYSISNPLLFKLLDCHEVVDYAVLMLQKEVAERISAQPATREYGVLSVLLGSCAVVEPLLKIGPENFHPRPKVDSMVVRIRFNPLPPEIKALPAHNLKILKMLVKAAFGKRRKTLLNALTGAGGRDKSAVRLILHKAEISGQRRPDQLTVREYIELARCFVSAP